ncbi:glycoside hydrolase family 3 N-terminal domain-containing protein [uncultured Pelagimonas sp.]|uniref:glycoside hydrolase family 3 N-terminal domain-containing protein n=1 Tax=uncultured Pelagimonas sp. TaxID=1618102 RepID=UPI002605275C|nr:glycoside hydrolase family 3 N-terminal domain-containing protein [uncultured Pelagimonas sp.]
MNRFGAAIFGCEGLALSVEEKRFFAEASPLGFILFARNIDTSDQVRALTSDLRDSVGWNAPVFIDQEGGRVQRLRAPLATEWLAPLDDVARFGARAAQAMRLRYHIIGRELCAHGINGNCAPMLDVARVGTHKFLRNRCYGSDLKTVIEIGRAVTQGHQDAGVFPVMKHIPGHGLAQLDSHLDLPRIDLDRAELDAVDFAAFAPFADLPFGMTAHLVFEKIDPQPATVSEKMINLIRRDMGFDGFLMTDDISMEALSGTVAERSAASIAAGCDAVLHCNGKLAEMVAIMDRVGQMTDTAQTRAEAALATRQDPVDVDIAALHAEFEALIP